MDQTATQILNFLDKLIPVGTLFIGMRFEAWKQHKTAKLEIQRDVANTRRQKELEILESIFSDMLQLSQSLADLISAHQRHQASYVGAPLDKEQRTHLAKRIATARAAYDIQLPKAHSVMARSYLLNAEEVRGALLQLMQIANEVYSWNEHGAKILDMSDVVNKLAEVSVKTTHAFKHEYDRRWQTSTPK